MDLRTGRLSLVPVCNEATVLASNSFSNENGSIDSRQWLTPTPRADQFRAGAGGTILDQRRLHRFRDLAQSAVERVIRQRRVLVELSRRQDSSDRDLSS